ncbi:HEPN-associated N-terminal domain-containing protein [Pseudomonas mandelii]|uniref:HEPN-associated N-terminal domain-containing protein n=1 Tax=Pseudomonas mandelii TaxID=75612 RepID=UPI003C73542D
MEAQERGWRSIDEYVCVDCVDLDEFKEIIEKNLVSETCSYCGKTDSVAIAAPVDDLLVVLFEMINAYYANPEEAGVPYDGGLVIEPLYLGEVLDSLGFGGDETLIDDIIAAWVLAAEGSWLREHEYQSLLSSWSRFSQQVRHVTRYHFGSVAPSDELDPFEIDPRLMLQILGRHLQAMVCTIPARTEVFRIRRCKRADIWLPDAETMGHLPLPALVG